MTEYELSTAEKELQKAESDHDALCDEWRELNNLSAGDDISADIAQGLIDYNIANVEGLPDPLGRVSVFSQNKALRLMIENFS